MVDEPRSNDDAAVAGVPDDDSPDPGAGSAAETHVQPVTYDVGDPVTDEPYQVPPAAAARRKGRFIDYPRYGKSGVRRWIPSLKLVLATIVSFVLLLTGSAFAVYAAIPVPDLKASVSQQHLTVLDRTGKVLGIRGPEIRQDVPLSKVPGYVQDAMLSAEDRNYWSDGAISVTGTARAALNNLAGGATQGGSTITQQYVKNAYLTNEQSMTRKIKEAVIALKISKQQSKSEILQGYLNTVYYGRGASGIQMAARAWFDKDVDQLTPAQGAVLAAAVNAPSYFETAAKDPQAMAKLTARWGYVLDGMVAMGKLTPQERALQKFPDLAPWPKTAAGTDAQYPYLVEAAIAEAEQKLGVDRQTLVTGGYTITTTFDATMQDAAAAAAKSQILDNLDPKKRPVDGYVQTAIATVVPGDGAVRVLYGGQDYSKQAFNASWQGTIAPGSTFKAFVLAAYLQNGGSAEDVVDGSAPISVPDGNGGTTTVPNEGGRSYGPISVRYATQQSVNTAYLRMSQAAGSKNVIAAAHAAGIPQSTVIKDVPTMPLGVLASNPMQMAGAYATFAAHGQQTTPYTVASVSQAGQVVYTAPKTKTQAFDAPIADQVTDVLRSVVTDGSGAAARLSDGREVAGKTGTTDLNGDRASAWFVGYTPELSTAVAIWGQKPDGSLVSVNGLMGQRLGGGAVAAPLWSAYMNKAVAGTPVSFFQLSAEINDPSDVPPTTDQPTGQVPTTGPTGQLPDSGTGPTTGATDGGGNGAGNGGDSGNGGGTDPTTAPTTPDPTRPTSRPTHRPTTQPTSPVNPTGAVNGAGVSGSGVSGSGVSGVSGLSGAATPTLVGAGSGG